MRRLLPILLLALAAGAFALCAWLLRSRAGYYWQAIRENEEAAQALGINTFRWKMLAVAISAAMTAVSGVFYAFYYNNLFPEQIFHISRSIELILGPIIGGIGTLAGPIVVHALQPGQHIGVLHHGEVIARGTPAETVRNPAVLECYLGEDTEL